jgi:hypothetical protein
MQNKLKIAANNNKAKNQYANISNAWKKRRKIKGKRINCLIY